MRLLAIFLLLISAPAFSETIINAVLEKGNHFDVPYRQEIAEVANSSHMQYKFYEQYMRITKFSLAPLSKENFNLGLYKSISFNITIDLIDYDKFNDYYQFRLTLGPGVVFSNEADGPYNNIKNAKIYFTQNNQDSIIIQGKFNRIFYDDRKDNIYQYQRPKINELEARPFILTIVTFNPKSQQLNIGDLEKLILSTQYNIPVTIKFD